MSGTARRCTYMAAIAMLSAVPAVAQEGAMEDRFISLSSYAISVPFGDTRNYVTRPSWVGVSWDGHWMMTRKTSAGMTFGVHDFRSSAPDTTPLLSGFAAGNRRRDLLVGALMASARWYPRGLDVIGPYFGAGAGGTFAQQSDEVGDEFVIRHTGFSFLASPEGGLVIPVTQGIAAIIGLRYAWSRNPYATISFGFSER